MAWSQLCRLVIQCRPCSSISKKQRLYIENLQLQKPISCQACIVGMCRKVCCQGVLLQKHCCCHSLCQHPLHQELQQLQLLR